MVKEAMGAKVKVFFQVPHMICVDFALIYDFKLCILNTPFNTIFQIWIHFD